MLQRHIAVTRLSGHAALMCEYHTNCFPFLCFVVANLFLPELILKNSIRTYEKANGS